ncbi:YIP1 family protein [Halorussus salilacus]|uniref:YIP1 family protein n=1 Tax=Halorussus salilacus TaxID=2953750 RepID=UPI00209C84E2|nr:YIP1 family protein [Halorussus salilacus]USZ69184.1 YIP1 family protein [Halorussus salilacus]
MKLILDPDEFFRREAETLSSLEPIFVVVFAAISTALIPMLILYYLTSSLPDQVTSYMAIFGSLSVVGGMLAIFGMWIVSSILLHFVAFFIGGEGSLRETIFLAGWGFMPMVFANVVNSVFVFNILTEALAAIGSESVTPQYLSAVLANHPLMTLTRIISTIGLVWMAFIWTFAVKNAHELSFRKSTLAATIPTLAIFVYWVFRGF